MIDPRDSENIYLVAEDDSDLSIDILVEEPQMPDWQVKFQKLNEKLGNEVWGARMEWTNEDDNRKLEVVRVFLESDEHKKKVLKETGGVLAGRKIVFTILSQENVDKFLAEES